MINDKLLAENCLNKMPAEEDVNADDDGPGADVDGCCCCCVDDVESDVGAENTGGTLALPTPVAISPPIDCEAMLLFSNSDLSSTRRTVNGPNCTRS